MLKGKLPKACDCRNPGLRTRAHIERESFRRKPVCKVYNSVEILALYGVFPVTYYIAIISYGRELILTAAKTMADASRPTVNYFCLGALLVFVGSVLLCTLGFTVVLPFEAMRSWPQVSGLYF